MVRIPDLIQGGMTVMSSTMQGSMSVLSSTRKGSMAVLSSTMKVHALISLPDNSPKGLKRCHIATSGHYVQISTPPRVRVRVKVNSNQVQMSTLPRARAMLMMRVMDRAVDRVKGRDLKESDSIATLPDPELQEGGA